MTVVISRRESKKRETRKSIISAARDVFSKHGIESASIDQIAALANVGKGTIYNYFATKEDIVVAFLVDVEKTVQSKMAGFSKAKGSPASILSAFLEFQFRLKAPHHKFVGVFLAQMFARGEAFHPWIRQLQEAIDPPLEELFRSLRKRGSIRADVKLADLIQIFKMIHLGLTATWVIEGPPWRHTRRLLRQEMKLFCEGLEDRP